MFFPNVIRSNTLRSLIIFPIAHAGQTGLRIHVDRPSYAMRKAPVTVFEDA
jgi:hypothetical protein